MVTSYSGLLKAWVYAPEAVAKVDQPVEIKQKRQILFGEGARWE
jgi:hypothetical protein